MLTKNHVRKKLHGVQQYTKKPLYAKRNIHLEELVFHHDHLAVQVYCS